MRNKWIPAGFTVAAMVFLYSNPAFPAAPKTVDEIALVVDQEAMTKGELEEAVNSVFAVQGMKAPAPGSPNYVEARKEVVEGFIREVLLAEEADREKVEISDGEIDRQADQEMENMKKRFPTEAEFDDELKKEGLSQDDLKQNLHDQLLRRMKANRVLQVKQHELPGSVFVTDEEVKKYFDLHPKDYAQVKFSIILFRIPPKSKPAYVAEVEKQSQSVLAELKGGADFAAYAKKYSEDQASAEKGGDVGTHYRVDLDPKLADGIFAIPVHGMGQVKATEGIYIVKVEQKGTADYDAVAPDIKEHLRKQKQDSAFNQWLDRLKKDAYIVEDGKVVAFNETGAPGNETTAAEPTPATAPESSPTPGETVKNEKSSKAVTEAAAPVTEKEKEIYPTLPNGGCLTLDIGGEGFSYGSQDLSSYYGPSVNTNQGFPFGLGIYLGLDVALDPAFQLGVNLDGLTKLGESVNFTGYTEQWSASTVGPGLDAKFLIPLDESTNFMLKIGGGYYLLTAAAVTVSGAGVTESSNFGGANFGGDAGGAIEFFLDDHKDSTLDLEVGYRYLKFQPLSSKPLVNVNGPIPNFPTPLTNSDGSQAMIDFSGVHVGLGLRFYLDKGSS